MSEPEKAVAIPEEAFLLFDRADDEALIARIQGAALKEYVYSFRTGGQDIFGLSVDGYEACKRELAKTGEVIKEETVEIEREDADTAYFRARASRWFVDVKSHKRLELDSSIGLKRQPKFTARKDGTLEPNSFWYETGGRKAIRNAGLSLIPEEVKQRIIAAYKGQAKPVKMTPEVADKLTDDAHQLFDKREAALRARQRTDDARGTSPGSAVTEGDVSPAAGDVRPNPPRSDVLSFIGTDPLGPLAEEHQALDQKIGKHTPARIVVLMRRLDLGEGDWTKLDLASKAMLAKHLETKK